MLTRIGVLGGTFDPIHLGHLKLLRFAQERYRFCRIYLIPTYVTPLKGSASISSHHRVGMIRCAIREIPIAKLNLVELKSQQISYTIKTLQYLRRRHPHAMIFFIGGSDLLKQFPQWRSSRDLSSLARFVLARRAGTKLPTKASFAHVEFFKMKPVRVSSAQIRKRIACRQSVKSLVPRAVEKYIYEKGLYLK